MRRLREWGLMFGSFRKDFIWNFRKVNVKEILRIRRFEIMLDIEIKVIDW